MTFANRVETAVQTAMSNAAPYMASKAEVCDAIQPLITELQTMDVNAAWDYIRASFSHAGHQALAVRMFKGQPV